LFLKGLEIHAKLTICAGGSQAQSADVAKYVIFFSLMKGSARAKHGRALGDLPPYIKGWPALLPRSWQFGKSQAGIGLISA
jgi:hypothetical protein